VVLGLCLVLTIALTYWSSRRGPRGTFPRLHAVLDQAAIPDAERLISEEESGSATRVFSPNDPATVTRAYASSSSTSAVCEELGHVLAPLGPTLATTSKAAGTIPFDAGYECTVAGSVEGDEGFDFSGSVYQAEAYRDVLRFSDETEHLVGLVDASTLSVLEIEVQAD
jgi:hypothetical protein